MKPQSLLPFVSIVLLAALAPPAVTGAGANAAGPNRVSTPIITQATPKRTAPSERNEKPARDSAKSTGKATYDATCAVCHATGVAGAPRFGSDADWAPRVARGSEALYGSALRGTDKGMPAKGGNADLADADVKAAVDYMIAASHAKKDGASKTTATAESTPAKPTEAAKSSEPTKTQEPTKITEPIKVAESVKTSESNKAAESNKATEPAKTVEAKPPAAVDKADAKPGAQVSVAEVNAINRLLKPPGKRNLPPPEDGIHDADNDGTHALQPPLQAFDPLPKSNAGNRVNWVQSLNDKKIAPRWDRIDGNAEPVIMDLNIIRKVKGSMPDVVYPHKQHTEWLDCSNCHPGIFVPQNGANQITMASILLGQKCGVCHGKVAFPVSECQ